MVEGGIPVSIRRGPAPGVGGGGCGGRKGTTLFRIGAGGAIRIGGGGARVALI